MRIGVGGEQWRAEVKGAGSECKCWPVCGNMRSSEGREHQDQRGRAHLGKALPFLDKEVVKEAMHKVLQQHLLGGLLRIDPSE